MTWAQIHRPGEWRRLFGRFQNAPIERTGESGYHPFPPFSRAAPLENKHKTHIFTHFNFKLTVGWITQTPRGKLTVRLNRDVVTWKERVGGRINSKNMVRVCQSTAAEVPEVSGREEGHFTKVSHFRVVFFAFPLKCGTVWVNLHHSVKTFGKTPVENYLPWNRSAPSRCTTSPTREEKNKGFFGQNIFGVEKQVWGDFRFLTRILKNAGSRWTTRQGNH